MTMLRVLIAPDSTLHIVELLRIPTTRVKPIRAPIQARRFPLITQKERMTLLVIGGG